jgi:hypothetical protein
VTGEQAGRALGTLVRKGREVEPAVNQKFEDVGSRMKTLAERVGRGAGRAEVVVEDKVAAALERLGFPTKEDVRELQARIEALTARLEEMQAAKNPPAGE